MALPIIAAGVIAGAVGVGAALSAAPDANAEAETATGTTTGAGAGGGTEQESGHDFGADGESDETKSESSTGPVNEGDNGSSYRFRFLGAIPLTEISRRVGIDRHAEAALVENLHAQEYARQAGGTVVEDGASAFTPDGGIDKTVSVSEKEIKIQAKHHGEEVTESVLRDYADDVDVIATSNGTSSNVDPADYDVEEFTPDDWSIRSKARLEFRRILNGIKKGLSRGRSYLGKITSACKKTLKSLTSSVGSLTSAISSAARAAAGWVLGLTTLQQVGLAAGSIGAVWLVWRRVSTD